MRAALYCRVSSDEQAERGTIKTQVEALHRYCAVNAIDVAGEYLDDGVSGTFALGGRPQGMRLLADAKAGRFEVVLVNSVDRLGRNGRLSMNAAYDLRQLGVAVQSATEPFETVTPTGEFMFNQMAIIAGLARDTIVANTVNGSRRRARTGQWLGGVVPYGYRVEGIDATARLVVSDAPAGLTGYSEADVVRLAFRLIGDAGWSTVAVARHLTALGVPTTAVANAPARRPTARLWWPNRISMMLHSATYRGTRSYGKRVRRGPGNRDLVEQDVPALVADDLWHRTQAQLTANQRFSRRNKRHQYLLAGLVKCGTCGLGYSGSAAQDRRTGVPRLYYRCTGRSYARGMLGPDGMRCPAPHLSEAAESAIWNDIRGFLENPGGALDELAAEATRSDGDPEGDERERAALLKRLSNLTGERDAVIRLYREGRITGADLDRQLNDLKATQAGLQESLTRIEDRTAERQRRDARLQSTEALLHNLRGALSGPPAWEARRALVEALVSSVVVHTDPAGDPVLAVCYRFGPPAETIVSTLSRTSTTTSSRSCSRTPTAGGACPARSTCR